MRSLTSIESTTNILAQVEFKLTASDQSTTWTFGQSDLVAPLPSINWQIDFGGKLGKTSNYDITISSSLGFIKDNLVNFSQGETTLNVIVNSDQYTPHVGRVRSFMRTASDPNLITFTVFDKFLNDNPQFPIVSLQDSYSTLHPEVSNTDWGVPQYYGLHNRPFYHVATTSDIGNMLSADNISSANHVSSVWYTSDTTQVDSALNLFITSKTWSDNNFIKENVSDISTQVPVAHRSFIVKDLPGESSKIFEFSSDIINTAVISGNNIDIASESSINSQGQTIFVDNSTIEFVSPVDVRSDINTIRNHVNFIPLTSLVIDDLHTFQYEYSFTTGSPAPLIINDMAILLNPKTPYPKSTEHAIPLFSVLVNTTTFTRTGSYAPGTFISQDRPYNYGFQTLGSMGSSSTVDPIVQRMSIGFHVNLTADNYKSYSIFSYQTNSSDIAISENPIQILENMFDQASLGFVQSQSSESQTLTSSYAFQCYFGEREPLGDVVNQFAEISKTYMWIGDSGSLNMRTYQNSEDVTIDRTIGLSDMIQEGFSLLENPLGTTRYKSEKANNITINYNYDFQKDQYLSSINAFKGNNSFCNSATAGGIVKAIERRTKYILNSDVASFYSDTIVRKTTQSEEFVNLRLPAKFFDLEVTDVINVQHPMIVGSESVYQILQLEQDLENAQVNIVAQELVDL